MPLESRVQSRTYQRQCRGTRQQPYRLPSGLRGSGRQGVTLELSAQRRDVPLRVPFEQLTKRNGRCECTTYDEQMQTDDVRSRTLLGDEAEETQRLPTEQRPPTNSNQGSRHSENPTLRSDLANPLNHSILSTERHVDSISLDPSTSELSSMIPNVVPTSTPSELSQSLDFVTISNRPPADAVQSSRILQSTSTFARQDSFNAVEPDQLTNHDRSIEKCAASPSQDVYSKCSSASYRSCRRSMSGVSPPSALARQVANRVIKHARDNKTPDELSLWCPDCKQLPVLPVTGQCGHSRCTRCIKKNGACVCGVQAPKNLHVNTLIQGLIRKMLPAEPSSSDVRINGEKELVQCSRKFADASLPAACGRSSRRLCGFRTQRLRGRANSPELPPHTLMSPQARFELARRLLASGRHRDAATHLARIAASPNPLARVARALLAQSIAVLSAGCDPRRLTRGLLSAVRASGAGAWLSARELECALCYHAYTRPVTTPCGHVYCRTCIERSMDYRKACALCLRSLDHFDLAATRETVFVCAALESIDALSAPPPPDPDVIPIFVCTVAYPAIPCPLFIFDPRYWLMIRRVLESGSRKFGMVAYERDRSYSDYGTVLEVCDCVHLEDGRSILSTVGVSRFRVIERDVRDGLWTLGHPVKWLQYFAKVRSRSRKILCMSVTYYIYAGVTEMGDNRCDVARIQPLTDITPTEELAIWELRIMATQISYKALLWLNGMSAKVRSEIEAAFGRLPHFDHRQEHWWDSSDGPAWLWWLIAILPLRSEIKILILSTKNLLKRMMAVSRTLDAIDQVAISATAATECDLRSALTNAEEWLERSA